MHGTAACVMALTQSGASASALLCGTGLDESELLSHSKKVSYAQMQTILRNAVALSPGPEAAFEAGRRVSLASLGVWGLGMTSARTYRELAEFVVKYQWVLGPMVAFDIHEADGKAWWTYTPLLVSDPRSTEYQLSMEFAICMGYRLSEAAFGPDFKPLEVSLRYAAPAHAHLYERFFGIPVSFGQQVDSFHFDPALLERKLPHANALSMAMVRAGCELLLKKLSARGSIEARVRELLAAQHAERPAPDIEDIAGELEMNPRTLRRRLKEAGTSFRGLRSNVLMDQAIAYLRDTDLTQEEIAARLGFSDGSNFRQAFRRWTDQQPGAFRPKRKSGAPPQSESGQL
ncbi:AraC family transcriptional regulator [Variovorax sp.]|uniref:AraC family transcriptional regulator n=1 Tax=Variovorax sp. TaxID=1871043 RepID=UPI003BAB0CDC